MADPFLPFTISRAGMPVDKLAEADRRVAARVDGKERLAARIAWELMVEGLRFRAVRGPAPLCRLEVRVEGRWETAALPPGDAHALLVAVTKSPPLIAALHWPPKTTKGATR